MLSEIRNVKHPKISHIPTKMWNDYSNHCSEVRPQLMSHDYRQTSSSENNSSSVTHFSTNPAHCRATLLKQAIPNQLTRHIICIIVPASYLPLSVHTTKCQKPDLGIPLPNRRQNNNLSQNAKLHIIVKTIQWYYYCIFF